MEGFNADLTGKTDKKGCQKLTHFVVTHLGRVSKIPGCQILGFGGLGMGPGSGSGDPKNDPFWGHFWRGLNGENAGFRVKKGSQNDPF